MSGKIYIASMNMRGKWAEPICDNPIKINVTSSQAVSYTHLTLPTTPYV